MPRKKTPAPAEPASSPQLEENQRLSQSLLWQHERNFFDQQGIQAWNSGAVPHYVTSNPTIARAYANVILAHLRDWLQSGSLDPSQPLYILELGAGCGRFAFHCLGYLQRHLPHLGAALPPVVYLMGDFAQRNLDYWQAHSHLQPFRESGLLDFAQVDASEIPSLTPLLSGQTLTADTLANPLIAIANYFFDCLPQDAFAIQDGRLHESLITLSLAENSEFGNQNAELNGEYHPELLDQLEIRFTDRPTDPEGYYEDADWNQILANYQANLTDTALLFPCTALRCLQQLHQLSQGHLLFLSADKGTSRLQDLLDRPRPGLSRHGSGFSLMVNYHAIGQYAQKLGGTWLSAPHRHASININGFLFGEADQAFPQTQQAYAEQIRDGGPDDFFALKKGLEPHYAALTLPQLLAFLRLSHWDSNIFLRCFPALMQKLEKASPTVFLDVYAAVEQVWLNYFPIQEQRDLAFLLGMVLYAIEYYPEALEFLQTSLQRYGEEASTFYNMAMCHYRLRQLESALACIEQTLALDPEFEAARAKRIQWQAELTRKAH